MAHSPVVPRFYLPTLASRHYGVLREATKGSLPNPRHMPEDVVKEIPP